MLIKIIFIFKIIRIVNSLYYPVKLSDIKSLTFSKYEKTEGRHFDLKLNDFLRLWFFFASELLKNASSNGKNQN